MKQKFEYPNLSRTFSQEGCLKIICSTCIVLLSINMAAQQTVLDEYLLAAAENNPELKMTFAEYQAAMEQIPQVQTLPDPMITFSYFVMPLETRTGARVMDFSLSQQFPWFGTLEAKGDIKSQQAMAKFEKFQALKQSLFFEIKSWYYRLYLTNAKIRLANENLLILSSFERIALTQFEAGRSGMANILKVQIETESLNNQILALKDQHSLIRERLNILMNRPLDALVAVADTLVTEEILFTKDALQDSIATQNPALRSIIYEKAAAEYQKNLARLEGKPDFMLGVTYGIMSSYENLDIPNNGQDMLMPMISVSLPIYRKKYNAMLNEADLMIEVSQYKEQTMLNELKLMLQEVWYEYLDAQRRISLYQSQTKLVEKTQELQLTSFTAAGSDFEEILRIQRELYDYRLELIQAIVENNISVAAMERLYGKELIK